MIHHKSGSKPCPLPNCSGFIMASLADRIKANTGETVTAKCISCHDTYCWTCQSLPHPSRNCVDVYNIKSTWMRFLKSYFSDRPLFIKLTQSMADFLYFKRNIEKGNLKRCPNSFCNRLIEKIEGCDQMVKGNININTIVTEF